REPGAEYGDRYADARIVKVERAAHSAVQLAHRHSGREPAIEVWKQLAAERSSGRDEVEQHDDEPSERDAGCTEQPSATGHHRADGSRRQREHASRDPESRTVIA